MPRITAKATYFNLSSNSFSNHLFQHIQSSNAVATERQFNFGGTLRVRLTVDFLASLGGIVVPIEVKASTSVKSPSLRVFMDKYGERIPLRVRFSMQNFSLNGNLLNIPLFMADETRRLLLLAMEKLRGVSKNSLFQ